MSERHSFFFLFSLCMLLASRPSNLEEWMDRRAKIRSLKSTKELLNSLREKDLQPSWMDDFVVEG